ncbi:MAG: cytochrome c [Nitrospirae bacterium]|nr:cytochrome c [Nitrospirota bacterium]
MRIFKIAFMLMLTVALLCSFAFAVHHAPEALKHTIKTDTESIGRGKNLFDAKCKFCHNAYNTGTLVGPGLKGILKNTVLPVSKQPATPENIRRQLRQPFSRMPSFEYLSEEEAEDIIAFLNTL